MTFIALVLFLATLLFVLTRKWRWSWRLVASILLVGVCVVGAKLGVSRLPEQLDDYSSALIAVLLAVLFVYAIVRLARYVLKRDWTRPVKVLVLSGITLLLIGLPASVVLYVSVQDASFHAGHIAKESNQGGHGIQEVIGAPFPTAAASSGVLAELVLFATMILGMSAKYLWDQIESRRKKNENLPPGAPKHRLEFDFWDFVQPLLVAGIIFAAVIQISSELNLTSGLFSFQNGFFWQTVIRRRA
jgi:hypothetical protein